MANTHLLAFSTAGSIPMIDIPAGEFLMGSDERDPDAHSDEMPQHLVRLQGFSISQAPITQAQWRAVAMLPKVDCDLKLDPSYFTGDSLPVERVSWHDAMEFCARLSIKTGEPITLPSEAQWEYVCRAGTTTSYAFGDTLTNQMANYGGNTTTPVGTYPANSWGLHDMHGNVWEWCLDNYHASYEGAPTDGSAWVRGDSLKKPCAADLGTSIPGSVARPTASGSARATASTSSVSASAAFVGDRLRVVRGGSWGFNPWNCRSAYRDGMLPVDRYIIIGFRVCCLPQD
jgi:formylglycine-generating enzyme required for sulfatase activity